ncbi:plasminogen-like [Branchiostoma floridae x Branchiostoma japonicum]
MISGWLQPCSGTLSADCYYLHDKGTSYRGPANRDRTCQFWTSQYPHPHNHTPQAYPRAGLEQNYCRNPDGKDRPWCYTNNPLIRWMYCDDVFACDAVPTRCFYAIDKGRSYAGNLNR